MIPIKYWHAVSDPTLLEFLGKFIQQTRLQQNKIQQRVATTAGINRSTLLQIENVDGGTWKTNSELQNGNGILL